MKLAYIIVAVIISLLGLVAFLYNLKGLSKFKYLTGGSKTITFTIAVISIAMMGLGGYYAYSIGTYHKPADDQLTKELKRSVKETKANPSDYKQAISSEDYINKKPDDLYKKYTKKGQADVNAYAGDSERTKNLILHNVGRKISAGENTTALITDSGARINLMDGKERVLVFADDSRYSIEQLTLLADYQTAHPDSKIKYVLIFPTINGTSVQKLFEEHSEIGSPDSLDVVTTDSMPENTQLNIKYWTTNEFKVEALPSFISIDSHGITSNAAVGKNFTDKRGFGTYLSRSFSDKSHLYNEIKGAQ